MARVIVVELDLFDNRPNIDSHVEDDNNKETNLRATPLVHVLRVQSEAETKATHAKEG